MQLSGRIVASTGGSSLGGAGPLNLEAVLPQLTAAFAQPRVAAVALRVNSPGGSPVQASRLYNAVRDLRAKTGVPCYGASVPSLLPDACQPPRSATACLLTDPRPCLVHAAFAEDVCASGGYYVAAAADKIFVDESSLVGSIGVIAGSFSAQKLVQGWGLERRKHVAGPRKQEIGDPSLPEDPEAVERFKELLGSVHGAFIDAVRATRREAIAKVGAGEERVFSGEVFSGRQAVELGLADDVGYLPTILARELGDKDLEYKVFRARKTFPQWASGAPHIWANALVEAAEATAVRAGVSSSVLDGPIRAEFRAGESPAVMSAATVMAAVRELRA